jgi:hypothetical protein
MDLLILKKYINMQIASFTGFIKALLYDCFLFFQIFKTVSAIIGKKSS